MPQKIKDILYKTTKLLHVHQSFVVLVAVLVVLTMAVIRINTLNNLPIDQAYYDQQTAQLKSVTFNHEAITKIEQLRDSNVVQPGTSLPVNRSNPFAE